MPSLRALLFAAFALSCSLLVAACNDGDSESATLNVEVGVVQSLSGDAAIYGKSVLQGIELAVGQINQSEDDIEMSVTLVDDGSNVDAGKAGFETLTTRNVTAIIGPTLSNVALQAMPVAQAAAVPVLGATTTAQGITEIGDYIFRVALTEAVVVPATIERVHRDWRINEAVLVLDSSDAFSRSSANAMRAGVQAVGGAITAEIDIANTDLASQLPALQAQNNTLNAFLITPLVDKSADVVRAIRGAGFRQNIIGGNSFNTPGMVDQAGAAVDGAYVGAAWNPGIDTSASERFVEAFTQKYGAAPDLFAAQGYSSVYLLLDAVQRAESLDRTAIRDALASIDDVPTPMGNITIADNREAYHQPVVQQFQDGELGVLP